MKGKRYTTEDKIRILREADRGLKSIQAICQENNISEVSFHRWKHQFGQMDVNEARRLKELERENRELKEMLAESLLKNRVLEAVCEKNCKPGPSAGGGTTCGGCRAVFSKTGLPVSATGPLNIPLSRPSADRCGATGRKKLRELSVAHPRYGDHRIAAWLHQEGWRVGKRHVQRLRWEEGLSVFHPQNARSAAEGFQRGCRRKPLTGTTCGRGILSPMPLCAAGRCGF